MTMQVPKVHGVIGRRLLVNFRAEPAVVQRLLPLPFRPKLHDGHAVAGICLIRLEDIRPRRFPRMLGLSSENAAHRIAVLWDDAGGSHEGVYIPRRDTGSLMNHLVGGRLFPGEHHRATFRVEDAHDRIALRMVSADARVQVDVAGRVAEALPADSIFRKVAEASAFFEPGSTGYSVTASGRRLDGVVLKTHSWSVAPLAIERVSSTYFANETLFPAGSVTFDCALIMRNVTHEWQAGAPMYI
jgi:Uncharacterized conserved protein (COG2071)